MSITTERLGLTSGQEAARQFDISPATVRSWRSRGYITPVAITRDGSKLTAWYRSADLWRCARRRLNRRQLAAIQEQWAEVDRLLAESAGQVPL